MTDLLHRTIETNGISMHIAEQGLLRARFGDRFMYILYFQEVGPADDELARDPRRTLSSVLWSASGDAPPDSIRRLPRGAGWLDGMSDPPELPPWLTEDELRYYAAEFERTGFTGGLNWYRNLDRNWELTQHLRDAKVGVPAVFIAGEREPFLGITPPSVMDGRVPDLRGTHLVSGAGHWVQQERPGDVNRILLEFLEGL
jgi:epoxide hydrolase A/B